MRTGEADERGRSADEVVYKNVEGGRGRRMEDYGLEAGVVGKGDGGAVLA
jgi:hypothetical protein